MDNIMLMELVAFLVISFRIYMLNHFQVKSVFDKMFTLYSLKNYSPFVGYAVLF